MTADSQPAGSPLAPVYGSARGPSPGVVLLLVVGALVGAIAVAVVTAPEPAPQPRPSTAAVAPLPAPASARPEPSASVVPSGGPPADARTIVVLRDLADPGKALGTLAGCTPLLRVTGQPFPAIKGSDVDATAVAAGRETGWIFVPPGIQAVTRVWLGDDVVELARAAGRPVVAVGKNGDVWLGGAAGAARWRPIPTPAGRTAWVLTADEVTSHGRCGPWPVPSRIAGERAIMCAGVDVLACVELAARVETDMPGGLYPGGDLALALVGCRVQSQACNAGELATAAVPAGWAGSIVDVQASMLVPSTSPVRVFPGAEPENALDAISRPSLPLPTMSGKPLACSGSLAGSLRAAAWDPKVMWVGATAVVWPAGTTTRFAGPPALTVPTPDGSYRFVVGAPVRLQGSMDARKHAFVVCAVQPVSAPAGSLAPEHP